MHDAPRKGRMARSNKPRRRARARANEQRSEEKGERDREEGAASEKNMKGVPSFRDAEKRQN